MMGDLAHLVDLHPVYQRDIRWTSENMCALISAIMHDGMLGGLVMYKLQAKDERARPEFRYEMIDGQHRFFTISKYFNSEIVTEVGNKPFLITWINRAADGTNTHIFFKKTAATEEWESQNRSLKVDYMTEDECEHFQTYKMDMKTVRDPLTFDQRRDLFVMLQKGVSVRGSDLLKNEGIRNPLVRYIVETSRLETPFKKLLADRCWMNPKNYWLHWAIRAFLIVNPPADTLSEEQFAIRDSQLTKMIRDGAPCLQTKEEEHLQFGAILERTMKFLDTLPKGVKLPPSHLFAVIAHLAQGEEDREEILMGHIDEWANNAYAKLWRKGKGWDKADKEEKMMYFSSLVDELDRIKMPALKVGERKTIPKKLREKVWHTSFGDEVEGSCYCCDETIIFDRNYHVGHIIAHAQGGSDKVDNLRPVCRSCNLEMGVQNMDDFKKKYYS
jgi:hypothetical protein